MKQLALRTAAVLAALACALVAWQFRAVVLLFVISLAVAAALRPPVDRLVRRRWPRSAALLVVYTLTLGLLLLVLWSAAGPVLDDVRALVDSFSLEYERLWLAWPHGPAFQRALVGWLPPPADLYDSLVGPAGTAALQRLLGITVNLFDILGSATIALMMSVYWGVDQARAERLWLSALPPESRARARDLWHAIELGVGAYLRSEFVQSLLAGIALGLGYWAMGLHYPTLLALLAALVWLVPWLGAALALGVVVLAAWLQAPWLALAAGVYTTLVFLFLEFRVEPRLYNRRQHGSLLVVLIMIVLGKAFGLAGVLAAPPLAAALDICLTHLLAPTPPALAPQSVTGGFDALATRYAALRAALAVGTPETEVLNLADRLEALLDEAGETLAPGAA